MDPVHYHFSQHRSLSYHEAPELAPEFYSKYLQDGETAIQTWVRVIFCRPAQIDHISPPMEGRKVMVLTHRKELVVGYEWLNPWGELVTSWHDEVLISNLPDGKPMRDWRRHSKCLSCLLPAVGRIQDNPGLTYDLFLTKRSLSTFFDEGSTHIVEETSNASDEMEGIEATSAKEGNGIVLPSQAATISAKLSDARRVAPYQSLFSQNNTEFTAQKQDEHATDTAVLMTPSISQQSHVSAISLLNPVAPSSTAVPARTSVPACSGIRFVHDNRREVLWTVASVFPNAGTEASQVLSETGAAEPPNHGQASPSYLHNAQPYIEGAQPYLPYLDVSMSREDHFAAAPRANEMRKKSFPPDLNWMNEWHEQDHVLLEPNRSNPDSIVLPPIRDLLGNIYHARRRPPQFRLRGTFPLELTPWKAKNEEGPIFQGPGYTDCSAVGSPNIVSQDVNNPFLYSMSPDLKEVPDMLLAEGGDLGEPPTDEMGILLRPMIIAPRNSRCVSPPTSEDKNVFTQEPGDIELSDDSSLSSVPESNNGICKLYGRTTKPNFVFFKRD